VTFIGNSVSQVFYGDLASHKDDYRRSLHRFKRLSGVLAILGLTGSTVLLTAPWWAGTLFGQSWEQAGWIMAAIVPMLVGRLVASSLGYAYYVYSKQHLLFIVDCARLGVIVATFTVSTVAGFGFPVTVFLFSLSMACLYSVYWLVILLFLRAACREQ
jgi:O-antigen/teichoic acid export membrane protein